jgi:hypothetical protein
MWYIYNYYIYNIHYFILYIYTHIYIETHIYQVSAIIARVHQAMCKGNCTPYLAHSQ